MNDSNLYSELYLKNLNDKFDKFIEKSEITNNTLIKIYDVLYNIQNDIKVIQNLYSDQNKQIQPEPEIKEEIKEEKKKKKNK